MKKNLKSIITLFLLSLIILLLSSFTYKTNIDNSLEDYSFNNPIITNEEFVYDKFNEPRFIMYTYSNKGYSIYDTYNNEFIERSLLQNSSPFNGYSGKFYYLGVNSYAINKDDKYYDIYSNMEIFLEDYNEIPKHNNISKMNVDTFNPSYVVPFYSYFKALDGVNNPFPNNENGDCGYVATTILLSYLANFYNSDLICEHNMRIANSNNTNNYWQNVSCANENFKNNILKKYVTNNASTAFEVYNAVENYKTEFAKVEFKHYKGVLNHTIDIANIVRNNNPVVVFTTLKDITNNENIKLHAILVYGVTTNGNLIAHLGYNNRSYVEISNSCLGFSGSIYYISISSISHKHSNYYSLDGNPYCMKCSSGSYYNPVKSTYSHLDQDYHHKTCGFCGIDERKYHDFTVMHDYLYCNKCSYKLKNSTFKPIEILNKN